MHDFGVTQKHSLMFIRQHNARRAVQQVRQEPGPAVTGRLPRVARLMALAIRFEHLLQTGAVNDQTELAELGHVTRARVTQIMNLLSLAPDIQEELLGLPRVTAGKDRLTERHLRHVTASMDWTTQRSRWTTLLDRQNFRKKTCVRN